MRRASSGLSWVRQPRLQSGVRAGRRHLRVTQAGRSANHGRPQQRAEAVGGASAPVVGAAAQHFHHERLRRRAEQRPHLRARLCLRRRDPRAAPHASACRWRAAGRGRGGASVVLCCAAHVGPAVRARARASVALCARFKGARDVAASRLLGRRRHPRRHRRPQAVGHGPAG